MPVLQYNYVLAAALDVGTLLSGIFIFLILGLPGVSLDWGGNNIYTKSESAESIDVDYTIFWDAMQ